MSDIYSLKEKTMTIETVGRILTRPTKDGKPDVVIGACFKKQTALKPNRIYEIVSVLGELILRDLGESVVGKKIKESFNCDICWGHDINTILEGSDNKWLTKEELVSKIAKEKKKCRH